MSVLTRFHFPLIVVEIERKESLRSRLQSNADLCRLMASLWRIERLLWVLIKHVNSSHKMGNIVLFRDNYQSERSLGIKDSDLFLIYNNYSMSPSWISSNKMTYERVARVGYNHFISNKGEWNNCFSKFSNRVLPPIFISTTLQSFRKENLAHYFPYDVKLRLLAHSRSFLANQKARNAIVGAENLLKSNSIEEYELSLTKLKTQQSARCYEALRKLCHLLIS